MKTLRRVFLCLLFFAALAYFPVARAAAKQPAIKRNVALNDIMSLTAKDYDKLFELYSYIKKYEAKAVLPETNVKVLLDVKELKADHKRILKDLDIIEKEIENEKKPNADKDIVKILRTQ